MMVIPPVCPYRFLSSNIPQVKHISIVFETLRYKINIDDDDDVAGDDNDDNDDDDDDDLNIKANSR